MLKIYCLDTVNQMGNFTLLARPHTGDYYEGNAAWMRAIHPRPVISPAMIEGWSQPRPIVFREDFYEPTARMRRGRFYQQRDALQIRQHGVSWHPFPPPNQIGGSGEALFEFEAAYEQNAELNFYITTAKGYAVAIGATSAETRWRVIDAEGLSDGTTLVSLKALSSIGLLPVVTTEDFDIKDAANRVVDSALRQDPTSTVDMCRESCRTVLAKYLRMKGVDGQSIDGRDLGVLITAVPKDETMITNAASIINRFHPRTKSAERESGEHRGRPVRAVLDDDALLAVRLFGFLLVEMKFAAY